jgi:anti-sigma regulatory factor (Ser/Thr protein kinase)
MNGVLGDRMGIDDVERADLILSELVTNAVVHGNSAALVRVRLEAHSLRIEVDDASPVIPIPREPDDYGGRGLRIVDQMTARWGTESRATGKTVWALLEH